MFTFKLGITALLIFCLFSQTNSLVADAASCTGSQQYFNFINFTCDTCPSSSQQRSSPTFCNCTHGYYKNISIVGFQADGSCLSTSNSSIHLLNHKNGSVADENLNCTNSYPNAERTQCIPCPSDMNYDTTAKTCVCTNTSRQNVNNQCIPTSLSAIASEGCNQNPPNPKSCQLLLNACAKDQYNQQAQSCQTLVSIPSIGDVKFPKIQFASSELFRDNLNISVSTSEFTNTTQLKNKLEFYVAQFTASGEFVDFRPLNNELFSCNLSQGDTAKFQSFGAEYVRQCTITFTPAYNSYYDLYIKAADGSFVQVPIEYIFGNQTYRKRFTQGVQSIKLNLTSGVNLLTPLVTLTILSNTNNSTAVISSQSETSNNYVILIPFIILNAVVLGYFIYAMFLHVKYNPENLGENTYCFRMMWGAFWLAIRCWTVGLFVWLAGISMFYFCFFKFQTALYMILPDPTDSASNLLYYTPFKTVFFIMVVMGLLSFFEIIWRVTSAEYFLLDWERPKEMTGKFSTQHNTKEIKPSIWRRLFVVNELYELAMKRLSSVEFTLLFAGLFLEGLKWSNLKYMVPNSNVNAVSSTVNPVLAYFITSFLLVTISLAQIVIRKLLKIWWPLPEQDFIDLCCLSNMSIFIFDYGIHGYYIHGMSPLGRSEGSLDYIQSIFQRESESYGRNRGLLQEDEDQIQSYELIAPRVMRFQFSKMYSEKIQQIMATGMMANTFISKPIPEMQGHHYDNLQKVRTEMINNFRIYLEQVKIHKGTQIQERNWFTRMFSCPPSLNLHQKLPVLYKDPDYLFTNVFLSGNQLFILINQINIFNFWYMIIGNTFHAIILTMVLKLLMSFFVEFKMKRNISSNTFVDDKFFV